MSTSDTVDIAPARLSRALQHLYAAALDPDERVSLPSKLAAVFDATSCLIHTRDEDAGVAIIGATANCTTFLRDYVEYYHAQDAWAERGGSRVNEAVIGEDVVPTEELLGTEWYNDLLRPCEIQHMVGAMIEVGPGVMGSIGIHRAPGAPSFEPHDRALMNLLVPHLGQALHLIRIADASARARRLSFDALAALSVGVVIVDADVRIQLANSAAERIVRDDFPIRVRNGRVEIVVPGLNDQMLSAVRSACLAPLGRSLHAGKTIVVPAVDRAPISLMIAPLPMELAESGPLAAVFIGETSESVEPSPQLVSAIYGLTPAETRLLLAIVRGERPAEYASKLSISRNTVRSQLKAIFFKTGSSRQSDIVRKVLGDPVLRLSRKQS